MWVDAESEKKREKYDDKSKNVATSKITISWLDEIYAFLSRTQKLPPVRLEQVTLSNIL